MRIIKFLPLLLLNIYCSTQKPLGNYIVDEDGITAEKIDSTKQYDEIFNTNNIIYTVGKKYTYSYYYQNTNGEKFLIKRGKEILNPRGYKTYGWEFVNIEKQDEQTINIITLTPNLGNPFSDDPTYNQTSISYNYLMKNGQSFSMETTGAIENEMNTWIHPPRSNFFKILELNPFPYIKLPYKKNTKWNWKLQIGDHWSDKRWLEWKDGIENTYEYEIKEKKTVPTKLGKLECFIVYAKAKSRIGETELISHFNPKFGFVKLEYKNIDGTKTVLELEKAE